MSDGEYDEHAYREQGEVDTCHGLPSSLTSSSISSLFVLPLQLDDVPLLLRESRPQLRRLRWERWPRVGAGGYHRRRTRTSWKIERMTNLLWLGVREKGR